MTRVAAYASGAASDGSLARTLTLGGLFGGWYVFNIYFNL